MRFVGRALVPATLAAVAVSVAACPPNLDDTTSIVGAATVIAIQSMPAEATPTTPVIYRALVAAAPDAGAPRLYWDYCNARNPLSNLGPISPSCVEPGAPALQSLGEGAEVVGAIPAMACSYFGPNAPPPVDAGPDGSAAGQPVDPDTTGGYYQPVMAFANDASRPGTLYQMRIACGFSGASEASQGTLTERYHVNTNPKVASLTAGDARLVTRETGASNPVTKGAALDLVVAWPSCPIVDVCGDEVCGADESAVTCAEDCMNPKGCAGAERYVDLDIATQTVVDQREGIHVAWYATAGTFAQDRTGVTGADEATSSGNRWTAPPRAELVTLWVVLRDDRGGVGWATYEIDVR